jgi:hypothetical protein
MKTNRNIKNLDDLHREKYRVSTELENSKKELQHSMLYLKKNHKSMIWSFINPIDKNTSLGSLLSNIKTAVNPVIQNAIGIGPDRLKNENIDFNVALALLVAESVKGWIEKRKAKKRAKSMEESGTPSIQDEI